MLLLTLELLLLLLLGMVFQVVLLHLDPQALLQQQEILMSVQKVSEGVVVVLVEMELQAILVKVIMERDGQNPVNLTSELEGDCFSPTYSPDSEKIAFIQEQRPAIIKILEVATGAIKNLAEGSLRRSVKISWNPYSDKIINNTSIINLNDGTFIDLLETSWAYQTGTPDWAPVLSKK